MFLFGVHGRELLNCDNLPDRQNLMCRRIGKRNKNDLLEGGEEKNELGSSPIVVPETYIESAKWLRSRLGPFSTVGGITANLNTFLVKNSLETEKLEMAHALQRCKKFMHD